MRKRILVPTDFSACSDSALHCALDWAAKNDAHLYLFHRLSHVPDDTLTFNFDKVPWRDPEHRSIIEKTMDVALRRAKDARVSAEAVYAGGSVIDFVVNFIETRSISYVFMGSRGRSKKEREELGSNALEVLKRVRIPVLIAKEHQDEFNIRQLVFASDFDEEAKVAFQQIVKFAESFNPEIHFLHIDKPKFFRSTRIIMKEVLRDFKAIAGDNATNTHFHKDTHVGHGIIEFCDRIGADLIAFSGSGRTIFRKTRFARPVDYLIQNANQPILFVDDSNYSADDS